MGNKKPAELVACGGLGGSESRTGARSYVIATPSEPITVGMSAAIADETMTAATAALAGVAVSIDVSFGSVSTCASWRIPVVVGYPARFRGDEAGCGARHVD